MIELFRLFVTLVCFGLAAVLDLKYREVPNKIWLVFGSVGLAVSFSVLRSIPFFLFGVLFGFWMILFYVGVFGGADAKGLITLTVMLPSGALNSTPFFPLYCLGVGCALISVQIFYGLMKRESLKKLEVPLLAYLFFGLIVVSVLEALT